MKQAHTRTFIRPLSKGGLNCQGVPLGLVNYMNLNRSRCMPVSPTSHMTSEGGLIDVVWDTLSLTLPRPRWGVKGFFTMYVDAWRRY